MKRLFALIFILLIPTSSWALENIIRPYQSIRSSSMGGLRITTGLYDENFYSNPARVTANPEFRFTLLDPMIEFNGNSVGNITKFFKSDKNNLVSDIASTAGENNHFRIQFSMPSLYFPVSEDDSWAFAFGVLTSIQGDIALRNSYQLNPGYIADIGPAATVGHTMLDDDALSVGATAHLAYRMNGRPGYSLTDYTEGVSLSPTSSGGDGTHFDFDLGATYDLPWDFEDFDLSVAAAVDNVLGGKYYGSLIHPIFDKTDITALQQPRSYGFGVSAERDEWGPFEDLVFGLEFNDIGNNPDGSLFRTVHIGAEAHFGILVPRVGINQGYLAAGFMVDLDMLTLELATYGEEMSKNVGGFEDRRYAFRLALQI